MHSPISAATMSSAPENTDLSDAETDPGYRSRSRSQSRRARRRKQQPGGKKQSMPSVPENQSTQNAAAGAQAQSQKGAGSNAQAQSAAMAKQDGFAQQAFENLSPEEQVKASNMQPFEWIGPDETSMNGPVTYAKAQRGEIAPRPGNPNQSLKTGTGNQGDEKNMMDQDGLKLRLELNLDIEIELKAKIKGDLTLALL